MPAAPQPGRFRTLRPGRLPYRDAVALQEKLLERRRQVREDILVLLEHPPVVTCGRRDAAADLLISPEELAARGIELAPAARGGAFTWHGPGQLVGYPIVDLQPLGRDLHRYLRMLEEMLIDTLADFGVEGRRITGKTGVWVGDEKIASIGVGVRRWVAWHGFALNVATDLTGFAAIVPCGLPGVRMTSLQRCLGRPVAMADVEEQVIRSFARTFDSNHVGDHDPTR